MLGFFGISISITSLVMVMLGFEGRLLIEKRIDEKGFQSEGKNSLCGFLVARIRLICFKHFESKHFLASFNRHNMY